MKAKTLIINTTCFDRQIFAKSVEETLAVFKLEDGQIVWTNKSSQTDESPSVKTGRTQFCTYKSSDFVRRFGRL